MMNTSMAIAFLDKHRGELSAPELYDAQRCASVREPMDYHEAAWLTPLEFVRVTNEVPDEWGLIILVSLPIGTVYPIEQGLLEHLFAQGVVDGVFVVDVEVEKRKPMTPEELDRVFEELING